MLRVSSKGKFNLFMTHSFQDVAMKRFLPHCFFFFFSGYLIKYCKIHMLLKIPSEFYWWRSRRLEKEVGLLLIAGTWDYNAVPILPKLVSHTLRWVLGFQILEWGLRWGAKRMWVFFALLGPICQSRFDNTNILFSVRSSARAHLLTDTVSEAQGAL